MLKLSPLTALEGLRKEMPLIEFHETTQTDTMRAVTLYKIMSLGMKSPQSLTGILVRVAHGLLEIVRK